WIPGWSCKLAIIRVALQLGPYLCNISVKGRIHCRIEERGNSSQTRKWFVVNRAGGGHEVNAAGSQANPEMAREGTAQLLNASADLILQQDRGTAGVQHSRHHGKSPSAYMLELSWVLGAQRVCQPV